MPPTNSARLRALIIGAGPTTLHLHLPTLANLRERGELELAIVCDLSGERAASARQRFGFSECCGDAAVALARPDIDVVYIFGSAQLHFHYGLQALESGKHLFVEKPIAPSYSDAVRLAERASERGLIAAAGLNRRFHKSLTEVRKHAGGLRWRFGEAAFHKAEFGNPPSFGAKTWLGANGIHALDALVFMMGGLPDQLTAMTGESSGSIAQVFSAVMRWRDGAIGVFSCNNNAGFRREEYAFHGQGESYTIDADGLSIRQKDASTKYAFPAIGDGIAAEHAAFLQAIHTGTEPLNSIAAIAPSMYLAELIESEFSGPVALPPVTTARNVAARVEFAPESILIVHSPELQAGLARLLERYRLVSLEDLQGSADQRSDIVAAVLGRGSAPLSPAILDRLPRLRVVGIMALSLARHEPEALLARGITVINASQAYADSVAEFAMGLAILGRRRAFASHSVMRAGGWGSQPGMPGFKGRWLRLVRRLQPVLRGMRLEPLALGMWRKTALAKMSGLNSAANAAGELHGAVVSLLGWGENAKVFAAHLRFFGARVLVYSEHALASDIRAAGAFPVSLAEALASDIVSLHRGLTPRTRHFLGANELSRLRPGSVLINTARGALIEPEALLARLRKGDIFACLDTYEREPLPSSHPLRRLPNVFLTAHVAGGSAKMHAAAADEVIRKVVSYMDGAPTMAISAERLRSMT